MLRTEISDDKFAVKLSGWDAFWAVRSGIRVPLAHICAVQIEPVSEVIERSKPMSRLDGTAMGGVIMTGRYLQQGFTTEGKGAVPFKKWSFWHVRKAQDVVVITLKDDDLDEIVIEVADPSALVSEIKTHIPSE